MLFRTLVALSILTLSHTAIAQYQQSTDLISLHYDHAPDRDDGHATVAALAVTRQLGIQPWVISGTYGKANEDGYVPAAEAVMQAAWGNDWINAHANRSNAVSTTADRWLETLESGGDVYVAEGGQSDFSADVVRNIRQRSSISTDRRITIVQHSSINERNTDSGDLKYVKDNTNYIKIDDGNHDNDTADLKQSSNRFVTRARQSLYASAWDAAFDYLNPRQKLDFSDTVELLYILDIGKNRIADPDDFADVFFSAIQDDPPEDPAPDTSFTLFDKPQPWSDSYSVGGQCYCDTNFDHGLRSISVETPAGIKSVVEICADIADTFGTGSNKNRVYFNTVHCGFSPANNASDEEVCPGVPRGTRDYTGAGCQHTGATWNLDLLYASGKEDPDADGGSDGPEQEDDVEQPDDSNTEQADDSNTEQADDSNTEQADDSNTEQADDSDTEQTDFPTCTAGIIDSDGDGYAWENNQSCIIDASVATDDSHTSTSNELPVCSAGISDDNGDGYGWENNQSCIIRTVSSDDSSPAGPVAALFPACSDHILDSDGDGYGWENYASCMVNGDKPTTVDITSPTMPVCSSPAVDEDGDGYGWENNQSCMTNSREVATATVIPFCSIDTADSDGDGFAVEGNQRCQIPHTDAFPICSATVLDDNGDGYGWENEQSCVLSNTAASATKGPAPVNMVSFPPCSADDSDSDGDGYGWENNRTCVAGGDDSGAVVLLSLPACSNAVTDSDNDGYGWENDQSCALGTALVPPVQSVVIFTFPTCSSAATDTDADGYGWENSASCVVAQQTGPQATATVVAGIAFPVCNDISSDGDGDGYGWENNASCIFPDQFPTPKTLQPYPDCSADIVDYDGDGYGTEAGNRCKIR